MKNKFISRGAAPGKLKTEPVSQSEGPPLPAKPAPAIPVALPGQTAEQTSQTPFLQRKNFYFSELQNQIVFNVGSKESSHNIFHNSSYKKPSPADKKFDFVFFDLAKGL